MYYVYLAINNVDKHTSTTIGFTRRLGDRIRELNTPPRTLYKNWAAVVRRKRVIAPSAIGHWQCIFAMGIDPTKRALNGRAIARFLDRRTRRMHDRFRFCVECARHLRLPFFVDVEAVRREPRIYSHRRDFVEQLASADTLASSDAGPSVFDNHDFSLEATSRSTTPSDASSSTTPSPKPTVERRLPKLDVRTLIID